MKKPPNYKLKIHTSKEFMGQEKHFIEKLQQNFRIQLRKFIHLKLPGK